MKTFKYILALLVFMIGVASCDKPNNIDPKNATEVPVSTLFTNAEVALVNQVDNMSVNFNISRLLVQYWQETTYFTEARYNFQDRKIPDAYARTFYRDVIMDLREIQSILAVKELTGALAIQKANQIAITEILQVYAFQCVVDAFGDMPYTEAFMGITDSSPVYDDAATIYADLLSRIAAAIASLDESEGSFGGADVMFGGDVVKWKKFAASPRLFVK